MMDYNTAMKINESITTCTNMDEFQKYIVEMKEVRPKNYICCMILFV